MADKKKEERKCFEFLCSLYPKCVLAAGSCCAIDDFFENVTIPKEECFDIPEKPLFQEKKKFRI